MSVEELYARRRRDSRRTTRDYKVTGQASEDAAIAAVNAAVPATLGGYTLDPDLTSADEVLEDVFFCTAEWQSPEEADDDSGGPATVSAIGHVAVSFDTSGGSELVKQSRSTVSQTSLTGGTAPDHGGAINVTDAGVDGVEIVVPALTFVVTHRVAIATVNNGLIGSLAQLTGTVNTSIYRGLDPGEGLLLGVRGRPIDEEAYDLEYTVGARPNEGSVTVAGVSIGEVKGWEYLWVQYAAAEDTTAKRMKQEPIAAYVEQVLREASWGALP